MKFLFEFVSCCVPSTRMEISDAAAPPRAEEKRSLAPQAIRKHRRRRRGATLPSAVAADWKPSLGAISEDKVVVVVMDRDKSDDRTAESERSVKQKSGPREARVHDRNNSNDFWRTPAAIPVVIPAFSPTPFLF